MNVAELAFEQAPIGTAVADARGSWLAMNPAFARLLGAPPTEPPSGTLADLVTTAGDAARIAALAAGETYEIECALPRSGAGADVWLRLFFAPLTGDDGRRGAVIVQATDVTERHHRELASGAAADLLRRSNRELEEFASVASHDLQEPLRKILAFADRISSGRGDADDNLDRIKAAARRMQTLIDDLLAFSRLDRRPDRFESVDLQELVSGLVDDLEGRGALGGARVAVEALPAIAGDEGLMRQLFENLISNALKFRDAAPPLVRLHVQPGAPPGFATIVCEDNGIGFEQRYAEKIFSIFERLHGRDRYDGTGIGLAMCRKIAIRHGGSIHAQGRPGAGARFLVTLPLARAAGGRSPEARR
jgi:PAS domain S-box-containing protein